MIDPDAPYKTSSEANWSARMKYSWKRFWCPREESFSLADAGYLFDPESEFGKAVNPHVVSFSEIANHPCLILLGEPGIGKSTAIAMDRDTIAAQMERTGDDFVFLDLREYGDESRLIRDCFDSDVFRSWLDGSHALHLFLDSLDECRLELANIASLLSGQLRHCKAHVSRLRFRIACRTAEWPVSLELALCEVWGAESVAAHELVPLRRRDVAQAVEAEGLDAQKFFANVAEKQAEPLAINPITLRFLIGVFRDSGHLPETRAELFEQGCRLLCDEPSETRRDAGHLGAMSARRKLAIASRIAAATIFCGKPNIFVGIPDGETRKEDLPLADLEGGTESVGEDVFGVREAEVREALATALFSGRGGRRLGFAHLTYAEFLAARYINVRRLDLTQKLSLIRHPADQTAKIVPQLSETAGWLANMDRQVFQAIIDTDPQVLLRSDVAKADDPDKARIVATLLDLFEKEELDDFDYSLRWHYQKLRHRDLLLQLRPIILDGSKNTTVRRVAIDLAEACNETGLQDVLTDRALDQSEHSHIRDQAAHAVAAIGDEPTRLRLRPLAEGNAGADEFDDLRGTAMRALWPTQMTTAELFSHVVPPKRESYGGAYYFFLSQELVPRLTPKDLPIALDWCASQDVSPTAASKLSFLMAEIVRAACVSLDEPGVLEAMVRFILSRLERHQPSWERSDDWKLDPEQRRKVLSALVPRLNDFDKHTSSLAFGDSRLIEPADLDWLIDQATSPGPHAPRWARLVDLLFRFGGAKHLDKIIAACSTSSDLAQRFSWLLTPVALNSPEADEARRRYREHLDLERRMKERRQRPPLDPPPKERMEHWLSECESDNPNAWWILNRDMQLEPTSTHYLHDLQPDLTKLPGWISADDATRARVVQAAEKYVLTRNAAAAEWLGTNTIHFPDFAGYRALALLIRSAPSFVVALQAERWGNWAAAIIGFPTFSPLGDDSEELQRDLVFRAYSNAPNALILALLRLIEHENDQPRGELSILRRVERCWDERLCSALLRKAQDQLLKPRCLGDLIAELLKHDCADARAFAESLIGNPPPADETSRQNAVEAAIALWTCTPDCGWTVLWPAFQRDPNFGKEVMSKVAHEERHEPHAGARLTDEQLAGLYIWLANQYPHSTDPEIDRTHWGGSRESVRHYRENILQILKARGTPTACQAIQSVMNALPNLDYLKWVLRSAKQHALCETWRPPNASQFFHLARRRQARLVRTADELTALVIEALGRLGQELHGETPAVRDLWDRQASTDRWRPVDENDLSDYVARYLRKDLNSQGIVALREVEIRRGRGGDSTGQRTDIHITGLTEGLLPGSYDAVRVILETKGCWHGSLQTAMETQLVDRYLKENDCQHGLYVVGWFNCQQWDRDDDRSQRAPKWTIDEARSRFEKQAVELSNEQTTIRSFVMDCGLR